MAGKLPPETEYPVPVTESDLIVTATVPLDVTVTDFVTAVPTATLPKESEVALSFNAADAAISCSETALELLPVVAVSVTDSVLLTGATFAVKVALVAPAGTVTELGIETAALLAPSATLSPPAGAGPDKLTVHESAIDPVIDVVLQETALTVGVPVGPPPVLFRLIDAVFNTVPCVAVSVTVCVVVTPDTLATKLALAVPAGTVTEIGTVTAALLLARATAEPPLGAGAVKVTLQLSVPAPVNDEFAQLSPAREIPEEVACPLPCSLTVPATVVFALVIALTLSCPVASVADAGSKPTCIFMLEPAAKVAGSAPAFAVNTDAEVFNCATCTGDVPGFVIDTV